MSLLDLLGVGKSVSEAQSAMSTVLQQVEPLMDEIENRLEGIISSNLDRLNGATITIPAITITINVPSEPKAIAVTPPS